MKAYAMLEKGKSAWIEKPRPVCGPLDAICKPLAISICTSDIHTLYKGALGDRHNLILGHECCGEVVEVGGLVKDFKIGDKVLVPAITPDWSSLEAQDGFSMHSGTMLGGWKFSNCKDGVFAEFFHVNDADANLAHLPHGMNLAHACMLSDMVPTGFHGAELADIRFGDTVLVIGIGPVGLMSIAAANLRGASKIITVGTRTKCIEVALNYGADLIIGYKNGSISKQVLKETNGKGVDCVIIAGGDHSTLGEAVKSVKPGGRISNVNYYDEGESISIPRIEWGFGMGHKQINGGLMCGGRLRIQKLAALVTAGKLNLEPLCTHVFHGFDKIEEGFLLMKEKPSDLIKPIVIV